MITSLTKLLQYMCVFVQRTVPIDTNSFTTWQILEEQGLCTRYIASADIPERKESRSNIAKQGSTWDAMLKKLRLRLVQVVARLLGELPLPWEEELSPVVARQLGVFKGPVLQLLHREPWARISMQRFNALCERAVAGTSVSACVGNADGRGDAAE